MKKQLQLLILFITLGTLSILPKKAEASHAAGGEILYEWISDSTYKLYYKFYRDCDGTTEPSTMTVCYENTCNSINGSVTLTKSFLINGGQTNGTQVASPCSAYPTTCNGGTLPGYQEWWYEGQVTLNGQCNFWRFYAMINARNAAITNISNPASQTLYVEATLNNLYAQGNSSPYFSVKPVPYVCINTPYTYNNGAVDPNNDSLAFEMIMPRTANTTCGNANPTDISFSSTTYNLTNNPFSTNNTFSLNSVTGQMSFTPNQTQYAAVTVRVKEYRNGILIGTVMRDIQIVVVSCNSAQPSANPVLNTISGATMNNGRIEGCAQQPLSFCVDLVTPDTAAILVASDNHSAVAPGSNVTYTGLTTDSIRACFSWTPGALDTGLKILTFTVKDSSCLPPGIPISQTFVIPVYIWPITEILKDTALCPGETVQLTAVGGSNFVWTVLPGGSPLSSLSCTNCKTPIASPTVTTRYVVTSNLTSMCNKNKDTVTIVVVTPPSVNAGPDIVTCISNSVQMNVNINPTPGPGTVYNIQWFPPTFLSSQVIANPVATPTNDITYVVTVTPNGINRCSARDTVKLSVLKGYNLLNQDTAICAGQSVNVRTTGDSRYNFTWTPAQNVSNPNIMNPVITPDTSRLYTVTASFPGCRDSVHSFYIDVQPVPTVYAGPDQTLCYGDTLHLNWTTVTPNSYPNYTYNWTPGGALTETTILHPIFSAVSTSTLTFTATTPIGCTGSDDITLEVVPADFLTVSSDTAICPGDAAQLRTTGDALSTIWRPAYYINDSTSPNPTVKPVVTTTYTVLGRDANHCIDTQKVTVTIKPAAVLHLPDSVTIYPGESYQMDPGGNCLYYSWFPPMGLSNASISNPVAQPDVNTRYFVTGRTEFGCVTSDSMDVFVSLESYIDVPNAFSPGSTPNNLLKAVHRGSAVLKSFKVFNRWGTLMFETTNLNQGWDGTYNGIPQPMGVYVYTIEATTPAGGRFQKQGNVTLIR